MNIYIKKLVKRPLANKTSCNAYSRFVHDDGSLRPCAFPRVEGDTVCKHHATIQEQRFTCNDEINIIDDEYKTETIKIDYKNHVLVKKRRMTTEVFRFINDSTVHCLHLEKTFQKGVGFISKQNMKYYNCSNRIDILDQCPHILDFFENEIKEVVESVYPSYIANIIMSYTDVKAVHRVVHFYRLRHLLNPMYLLNDEDMYTYFRFKVKRLFTSSDVLASKPRNIDHCYRTILHYIAIYKGRLSNDHFKLLLNRLKLLKLQSYKQNLCDTPEIEFS